MVVKSVSISNLLFSECVLCCKSSTLGEFICASPLEKKASRRSSLGDIINSLGSVFVQQPVLSSHGEE